MEGHGFYAQFYGSYMPRYSARYWAAKMARKYGLPAPTLQWVRKGKRGITAEQIGPILRVNIDKANWTPMLLAHEMAHYIVETKQRGRAQDHGPVWLGVYIWLLDKYHIVPAPAMLAYVKLFGLKAHNPAQCAPDKIKVKRK